MNKKVLETLEFDVRRIKTVEITYKGDDKISRIVTIGQVVTTDRTSRIVPLHGVQCGITILNPSDLEEIQKLPKEQQDERQKLANSIAEGKAKKNPVSATLLIGFKPISRNIVKSQFDWTVQHLEENLVDYIPEVKSKKA